ncbi:hypothetical protein Egran_02944 [Elaphomyces granulatus]|uniref:GPI transamidase component PIG-S n=1 Tax=Elaphomyces granulatus TaxID=519963 RepID=A0A232LZP2_9EURO|nr:hypothetical protein Egran_02944 [Elaphomyces granulatus]
MEADGRRKLVCSDTATDTAAMAASTSVKHSLPPEKHEAIRNRSKVIFAFWTVIVFLGLPIWWKTTSIYRARLPIQDMIDWADGKACRPVFPLEILFRTPSMQASEAQGLIRTTQHALDDLNDFPAHHLRLKLVESHQIDRTAEDGYLPSREAYIGGNKDAALIVTLIPRDNALAAPSAEMHSDSNRLDIYYPSGQAPALTSSNSPLVTFIAGEIQKLFNEEKATIAHILQNSNAAGPSSQSPISGAHVSANSQSTGPPQLADAVGRRLAKSLKYAETYHLTFSLFTPGSEPSSWDIETAIHEYLTPLLEAFSPISDFSVDTQVQLYASFAPTSPAPEYNETQAAWTLKMEDLSAFMNAAEWPLSPSIGSGPTINFVLYVPAPSQSPLLVENQATSWVIPQWGGVAILNPPLAASYSHNPVHLSTESLRPVLLTFSHQLLTLLGTPSTPSSLPFCLQTLVRIRAANLLLSASSTMGSLARLTQSLPSIPIPVAVATSVSTTLSHLAQACDLLREGQFMAALASARISEKEAEKSFFEKTMVGQVYFPDEHKVAVYLPLLGPIGVPLVIGLIKELRRLVSEMKQRKSGVYNKM